MAESGKRMLFEPATIKVRRGEQVRFVLTNEGGRDHEQPVLVDGVRWTVHVNDYGPNA
jgi:uncharacterized cupredoxin-like copper-binding protein